MHGGASRVCLLTTVAILLTVLYPALFLDCRLAPEASLKSAPPWRELLGPLPKPAAEAFAAATGLGPRLSSVARNPFGEALWNPWIGGGRPGWLSAPEDGGTPLVLSDPDAPGSREIFLAADRLLDHVPPGVELPIFLAAAGETT